MSKQLDFLKSIRILSKEDLTTKLNDSKVRLQKLSFSHKVTPIENPKIIGQLRKDIARMKTVLIEQH